MGFDQVFIKYSLQSLLIYLFPLHKGFRKNNAMEYKRKEKLLFYVKVECIYDWKVIDFIPKIEKRAY